MQIALVHMDSLSCEPIVRRAPNGNLFLACQCGGTAEPSAANRVHSFISADDGKTWTDCGLIYPDNGRAVYQTETYVFGEEIRMFVTEHNGLFSGYDCFTVGSSDSGKTFVRKGARPLTDGFVFARGIIKMPNGRLLQAYQEYPVTAEENATLDAQKQYIWKTSAQFVRTGVYISDDDGKNFATGGSVDIPLYKNGKKRWVWSEPTLACLPDGSVIILVRIDGEGRLYKSISSDGGKTFSPLQPTDILNPSNKAKLVNLPFGKIALLNTPNGADLGLNNRFPLEIWISDDGLKTFYYKKKISDFPGCYSYPDGFYENGYLYFCFDFNRHDVYFVRCNIKDIL